MGNVVLPHEFQDGIGQVASGDDVMDNLNALVDQVNGNIDSTNVAIRSLNADRISDAVARLLAVGNGSIAPRAKSIINTQESISSTTYAFGPTHDEAIVDMPTDGILWISAYVEVTATTFDGAIGLFIDGNLCQSLGGAGGALFEATVTQGSFWQAYSPKPDGWQSSGHFGSPPGLVPVSILAQIARVGIAAGPGAKTVSIRYKAGAGGGGVIDFRNRKLWVEAQGF